MIISSDINNYAALPNGSYLRAEAESFDATQGGQSGAGGYTASPRDDRSNQTLSKVLTETDGSTVMQYTTISPGGSIMRKNVTLHQADAFPSDPLNPSPMLRRRADVYESMMQIF